MSHPYRRNSLAFLGETISSAELFEQAARHSQSALTIATAMPIDPADQDAASAAGYRISSLRVSMALTIAALARLNGTTATESDAMTIVAEALPQLAGHHLSCLEAGFAHHLLLARSRQALATWHTARHEDEPADTLLQEAARSYDAAHMPNIALKLTDILRHTKRQPPQSGDPASAPHPPGRASAA